MNASDLRDHFVYRCFDSQGRLLYVGCTKNLARRHNEHSMVNGSSWWPQVVSTKLVGPLTYRSGRDLERLIINTEFPLHNHDEPHRARLRALRLRITRRWFRYYLDIDGRPTNWHPAAEKAEAVADAFIPNSSNTHGRRVTDEEVAAATEAEALDSSRYRRMLSADRRTA